MKPSLISRFLTSLRQEYRAIFTDAGVMVFFLLLPTAYPIVYTLIYNPEVITDIPVAVVDLSHTPESRQLIRMVDATEEIAVAACVTDMPHARQLMAEHEVYGILLIPDDYADRLALDRPAVASFYADTSRLLRYRSFASALTDVTIAFTDAEASPIPSQAFFLGDVTQGFASFIIPGILIIILQQSLLLGITMLAATRNERRIRLDSQAPTFRSPLATLICCLSLYIPLSLFGLQLIPRIFRLPVPPLPDTIIVIIPMLIATTLIGMLLGRFMRCREDPFLLIVFTSPIVLFLSGLTWPRYAMSPLWYALSSLLPSTWAIHALI